MTRTSTSGAGRYRVFITGATGYIGRRLVATACVGEDGALFEQPPEAAVAPAVGVAANEVAAQLIDRDLENQPWPLRSNSLASGRSIGLSRAGPGQQPEEQGGQSC